MKIPDYKVKIEERSENGQNLFYLEHRYLRREFEGLPADGPYATENEALDARIWFVKIVEDTLSRDESPNPSSNRP